MVKHERVGITDGGGRGAALVHAYSKSPDVKGIIAIPGNDLMSLNIPEDVSFERVSHKLSTHTAQEVAKALGSFATIADVCQDDMTAGGAVNTLLEEGFPVVGPTKEAARLEWDKAYARVFMRRHHIPHPDFHIFQTPEQGCEFLRSQPDQKWAVKASGLALGKGVIIAANNGEAIDAVHRMREFGDAGSTYLVEQCLVGEEFSTFAVSDGNNYTVLGSAQDHKRLLDGDEGPNTGGMGCSSSPLILTPDIMQQVHSILEKTFAGLRKEGTPYTGVLYLGGMVVDGNVTVIEYNSRWGDPEAEVVLPGIQTDLLEISRSVIEGRINALQLEVDQKIRVAVALASRGYPATSTKGKEIFGIDDASKQPGVTIYGAAVRREDGHDFTDGGRLLYVVGEGSDVSAARNVAYGAMDRITVDGDNGQFRKDIGERDVARLKKQVQ